MAGESVIPTIVLSEAKEAEAAVKAAQDAANKPPEVQPVPEPEKTEPKPEETPPVEAAPEPEDAVEAKVEPEPTPPPEPEPEPVKPDLEKELARLRQAQVVLSGKYTREVPRMARELREKDERIRQLEAQVQAKAEAPADPKNPYGLSEAELELGPEFVSAAEKIASRAAAKTRAEMQAELAKAMKDEAGDPFYETLTALVPDWMEVDADPQFRQWLSEVDPSDGLVRDEKLQAHKSRGNGAGGAQIVNTWKALQRPVAPAPKTPVAAQVQPSTRKVAPKAGSSKPVISLAEYERRMDAIAFLQMESPVRAKKLKDELDEALREGRVR